MWTTLGKPKIWAAILVTSMSLLTGCQQFDRRADLSPACPENGARHRATGEKFDPYNLDRPSPGTIVKVIEFTDAGELHDRCQLTDVYYEIRGGRELDDKAKERAKFIVVYVHGWKHDASANDSDFKEFSRWIDDLTRETKRADQKTDVIGVYISWPGKSVDLPLIEHLTFWGRKGAADRVSGAAYVSKILSTIESIRRQRKNDDDFTIGIGHSFGARILFGAMSPLLLHELQTHHPGIPNGKYQRFTAVMDLTILLNPAFEAARYTAIDSSKRQSESFHKDQQPLLLSISTSNDFPNRTLFPIGQVLGTRITERERITIGSYDKYLTHNLEKPQNFTSTPSAWYDHFCNIELCLTRVAKDVQPGNPFLVARTGPEVIDGHNGIWPQAGGNSLLRNWLMDFILNIKKRKTVTTEER